jgi:signal peptidase I
VKRAIGLPGETIEMRDKAVYINGKALDEPYKHHSDSVVYSADMGSLPAVVGSRDNFAPLKIPGDSYFMMGDNRDDSADSRYFGVLPRSHIVGRPLIVFWSYEDEKDAYLKESLPDLLALYAERVVFFLTRTRWTRTGHVVR